ncbi:MAG: D-glycerate dehydrogenase [Deinococcus sp.]|nr:D-glycerate dehydrogenase [Deinococcus sp.]
MKKPKVYVTSEIPDAGLVALRPHVDLVVEPGNMPPPRQRLLEMVRDLDGLLPLLTCPIDAQVMDAAPKLKIISNYAVGFDNIDVPAATARGIPVTNTPGVLTETTADLSFTLLMAAARRITEAERFVRAGKWKIWDPKLLLGQDIWGATLGIVGMGRIGREMAKRAKGFSMRVIYTDAVRSPEAEKEYGAEYFPSLDDVLKQADFVTLHTPLLPETRGLIGEKQLKMMKPTAVLVNTSRGPVVKLDALYQALKNGTIFAAGLDVTDPEPLPANHPLLTLDNCIIVPHIASASVQTRNKMALLAASNLLAGLKGEKPTNLVNPEVWGKHRK